MFSAFTPCRLYLQDTDGMPNPTLQTKAGAGQSGFCAFGARRHYGRAEGRSRVILAARQTVAQSINSALVLLYWQIGVRIRREVLHDQRAGYGERIFDALSRKLTVESDEDSRSETSQTWSDLRRYSGTRTFCAQCVQIELGRISDALFTLRISSTRFLRRDVPHRTLEHTDAARKRFSPCSLSERRSPRSPPSWRRWN